MSQREGRRHREKQTLLIAEPSAGGSQDPEIMT